MVPFSKDTQNKNGAAPCIYIIDEYHEHKTAAMYEIGDKALGKRAQSLMYIITTAGADAENSPCKKEHDLCCKILNREIIQEDYFCMIRCLDKDDNPHDFANLPKANPMLHEMNEYAEILLDEIISEHNLAYGSGDPAKIREWLIKRCCLWQEGSNTKYMDGLMDVWKSREVKRQNFEEMVRGLPCLVGDDMSKRIDLTGQAQLWKLPDGRYALRARGFIPKSGVTRHEHTDRVEYKHWAKHGHVIITDGDVIDYDYLIEDIHQQETDLCIKVLEFDIDAALATSYGNELIKQKYEVAEIRQNITTLSEPTKLFREMTIKGELIHEENPCLDWCLRNAEQYTDPNENIRLSKKNKDDSQRIDLVAAAINCVARLKVLDDGKVEDVSEFAEEDFLKKLWD
jgi:phage terminase large subunit-like protein